MKILSRTVGPLVENSYLVIDETTNDAIFIDPGDEPDALLKLLEDSGATLKAIWLTHGHLDHIGAIEGIRRKLKVPVHLHPDDSAIYEASDVFARTWDIPFEQPAPHDIDITTGTSLTVGTLRFDILHAPGHSPGHVVFHGNGVLFGGDILFEGSIGRTDLPFSDPEQMTETLRMVADLPHDTVVYPGHGAPTTIGAELRTNPFLNGIANVKRNTN